MHNFIVLRIFEVSRIIVLQNFNVWGMIMLRNFNVSRMIMLRNFNVSRMLMLRKFAGLNVNLVKRKPLYVLETRHITNVLKKM